MARPQTPDVGAIKMKILGAIAILLTAANAMAETNNYSYSAKAELIIGYIASKEKPLSLVSLENHRTNYLGEIALLESDQIRSNAIRVLNWSHAEAALADYSATRSHDNVGITVTARSSVQGHAASLAAAVADRYIKYRQDNPLLSTNGYTFDVRLLEMPHE